MAKKKPPDPRQTQIRQLIDAAQRAASAKGWDCYLQSEDTLGWRYATLMVSRGISGHHVIGLLDLTLDESSVKSRISKTSFYGTGLEGVQEAVMAEVRRLSWIDKSPKSAQPALTASQQRR